MKEKETTKLKEEINKLKKVIDLKSDLITISAHQLRTSLSAFKWVIKMFLDNDIGKLNIEQKSLLKKSYEENERIISLVNEMINLNHAEDLTLKYKFEKSNIIELIDDVLFNFTGESYKRGIEIIFLKPDNGTVLINIDIEKIRVVLQNLIENSIKYSNHGDKIFVVVNTQNKMLEISVKDTGIGIPMKDQQKIFGKFFRASNAKQKDSIGSGLGLFTIKDIIEKHNGKIWFESKENKGSTFFFALPVARIKEK